MSWYVVTGLIVLAIYSSNFLVNNIIHTPLLIVVYPKWARLLSLGISALALVAAYQLQTSNQAVQACSHGLHACSHDFQTCKNNLQNATQQNAALMDNHPMKGVPVLRAELSKCQTEKSMLGWFDDAWRVHVEENGEDDDDEWRGRMIDTILGQMKDSILSAEKKRRDEKREQAEDHEEK